MFVVGVDDNHPVTVFTVDVVKDPTCCAMYLLVPIPFSILVAVIAYYRFR